MRLLKTIDADAHFNEQADTWSSVPRHADVPRLRMDVDNSTRRWLLLGERPILPVRVTTPGEVDLARRLVEEDPLGYERYRHDCAARGSAVPHPAESDAAERLKVMDGHGIGSALVFPSFGLFWPSVIEEGEVSDANFSAWNDWIASAVADSGGRLLPVAQYSLTHVERTVAEIRRSKALRMVGLFLRAVPYRGLPWSDPSNEGVWTELEECGLPLILHAAPQGSLALDAAWERPRPSQHVGQSPQTFLNRSLPAETVLADLVLGGVLHRHPRLRLGVIEFGSTWLPSFLHRLDYSHEFLGPRNRHLRESLPCAPSQCLRRQVKVSCAWNEPLEWLFDSAGPELFMFSTDFPHPEGNEAARALAAARLRRASRRTRELFFTENARWLVEGPRAPAPQGTPEEVANGA